jgi:hypothetical protein
MGSSGAKHVFAHAHFVNSVFEKIFSIGTSYFLHHAAVILKCDPKREKGEREKQIK